MNNKKILAVDCISKSYFFKSKKIIALDTVSFQLAQGDIVGVLGPNGSGKSTLMKSILSLVKNDSGTIEVFGDDISNKSYLKNIGALIEGKGSLQNRLTIYENAKYYSRLREAVFDKTFFYKLAEILKIEDVDKQCRFLSTGNKQKAAILCTLIHKPKLVFFDEPTLGIDVFGTEMLLQIILELKDEQKTTFILSTHDINLIKSVCERLLVVKAGKIIYDGNLEGIEKSNYLYIVTLPIIYDGDRECYFDSIKHDIFDGSVNYYVSSSHELKGLIDFSIYYDVDKKIRLQPYELKNNYMRLFE